MEVYPSFEFESQEARDRAVKDHLGQGQGLRFTLDVHKTTISDTSPHISIDFIEVHRKLQDDCKNQMPTNFEKVKRRRGNTKWHTQGLYGNFDLAIGATNWPVDICYKRSKTSSRTSEAYFYHPWKDIAEFLRLIVGDIILFEFSSEKKINLIGVYRVQDELAQPEKDNLDLQPEQEDSDEDQTFLTQGMLDNLPYFDDLETQRQEMEVARKAFIAACVAARERPNTETADAVMSARLHLLSFRNT